MPEFTLDTLGQRMNRLEREVRRWRVGAAMLLTCAIAVLVMGQTVLPKPQVIEAQRFILKSPDGTVRAILGQHLSDQKAPFAGKPWDSKADFGDWGLHLFGPDRGYRAGLMSGIYEDVQGGYLHLVDAETESNADLLVHSGEAHLTLSTTTQSHVVWKRQMDESFEKRRAAKTPKERLEAEAIRPSPDVIASLSLGKERTALTLSERGGPDVVLGHVEIPKPYGGYEQRPLSSLVLFDKYRQVIWKAP
jgi:hypothetical protein